MSAAGIAQRLSRVSEPIRLKFATVVVAATAVTAVSVGRPVFVPLSLAVLIAFALAPIAEALRKFRLGPIGSVAATAGLAFAVVAAIALFLAGQFGELAAAHTVSRVTDSEPLSIWIATSLAEPLLNPLRSAGIAVVFAALLLLNKDTLAERFAPMAAAGRAFGRHLLAQGLLDLSFGTAIALGLWALGVPNFGLWALLGVMLRSVPFVGVPVAAACPLIALDPTAALVCKTLLLFLAVNGAVLFADRKLRRRPTARLSTLAAIGATIVWTCLWGLTGLLLAMPMTLGLALLGRHFEPLRFLDRLLVGSKAPESALPRGDAAMLALAEAQREIGASVPGREIRLARVIRQLVPVAESSASMPRLAPHWQHDPVLCVAGPGIMDQAAAALLAETLRQKGLTSRVAAFEDVRPANLPSLDVAGVQVVCVSCLDPGDTETMRRLVRRLRPRLRNATTIAGL
jgi:predicted PurR-regulated permease PerM